MEASPVGFLILRDKNTDNDISKYYIEYDYEYGIEIRITK